MTQRACAKAVMMSLCGPACPRQPRQGVLRIQVVRLDDARILHRVSGEDDAVRTGRQYVLPTVRPDILHMAAVLRGRSIPCMQGSAAPPKCEATCPVPTPEMYNEA